MSYTKKQLIAFIDDHSRFIVHAELFDNATTENTIIAFEKAIKKYGITDAILTDNGCNLHLQKPNLDRSHFGVKRTLQLFIFSDEFEK